MKNVHRLDTSKKQNGSYACAWLFASGYKNNLKLFPNKSDFDLGFDWWR